MDEKSMVIWMMSLVTLLNYGVPRSITPLDTSNLIDGTGNGIAVGSIFEVSSGSYDSMVGTEQSTIILTSSIASHKALSR